MSFSLPDGFVCRMQPLLGDKWAAFTESQKISLRRSLRVNLLKAQPETLLPLLSGEFTSTPFCPAGCRIGSDDWHPATDPLHHAGAYYMQEASAMSAVTVLAPQPGEWVLDLCAAPGGKSTQIAAGLKQTGLLWSNEYVAARARILRQNLERCGVRNSVVSNAPADLLCRKLAGCFDAVLVDAPCSGEGMFRKEPAALEQWSLDNIRLCASRQEEILEHAAEAVRPGGRLIYSTCTFAPEENECRIGAFLLAHPDYTLDDCGVSFGQPAFEGDCLSPFIEDAGLATRIAGLPLSRCRRIFPFHGGEGHFIALLRRSSAAEAPARMQYSFPKKDAQREAAAALYADCFTDTPEPSRFVTIGQQVLLLPAQLPPLTGLPVLSAGFPFAEVCKNRLEPTHWAFTSAEPRNCRRLVDLPLDDERTHAFLHGEAIACDGEKGWTGVAVEHIPLGFGKASGGQLKNRYPKGLRI